MKTKNKPEFIVMLTHNDRTVENAKQIFDMCRDTAAKCWGFKEHPLPLEEMKALYTKMKAQGKTTFLEVVAYTEEEGLAGAQMAVDEAKDYLKKGVYGIDLLAYRYQGDASLLVRQFVREVPAPVCIAGSVNSLERLDELKAVAPWAFTIGGALFENKFGETIAEQVDFVCEYISR